MKKITLVKQIENCQKKSHDPNWIFIVYFILNKSFISITLLFISGW